jgi:uncharacterized FlaG/YvyC family protein
MEINGVGLSLQSMATLQVERQSGERKGTALVADVRNAAVSDVDTRDVNASNAKVGGNQADQAVARNKGVAEKTSVAAKVPVADTAPAITNRKAYFAVDENKNVVIKIEDENGKVVRQIPPEEYLKMVDKIKQSAEKLFHTVA